ncbi:3',5'-cyclic-nucleotide phosphodiesterase [Sodalis praecaptivus]|uniref:3',5'-cyclic-nucleotide phosphodiesterase n=1 Tax=Sodalis praecaptivus TaxID=1239307 RepID=W0HUB0_9GAMM|nr:metallophosphoesterase [Sodalis praecaptivus]AHF75800.1 3',5'-cyclic-nucleotide phosphodiesterase [Sodalis praecaptivus]
MKVLQISDTHLLQEKDSLLLSVPVYQRYLDTLQFIVENQQQLQIDSIIVTGDISHDGSEASYASFLEGLAQLKLPFSLLMGNHDNQQEFVKCAAGMEYLRHISELGGDDWYFLSLDSVVNGEDYGVLDDDALVTFEECLKLKKHKNKAVFLHHHILPVGTPLVDVCNLRNADSFLALCKDYGVKFIGTGHAHTPFQTKWEDILISVSPAICYQWRNGTENISIFNCSGFNVICFADPVHIQTYFI